MKVALVSTRNVMATGIDRYAATLASALEREGVEVVQRPIRRRTVRVAGREVGGFASLWVQRLAARRLDADLVHAVDPAVVTRGTSVVTILDLLTEQFPEWYLQSARARLDWSLTRALARRVPWMITCSEATRQETIRRWGVAPERIATARLGIDHERFSPRMGAAPHVAANKPNIVYAGDDNPRKNVGLAVRAMVSLRDRHKIDARLIRVGPARFPEIHGAYRDFARRHGVDLVEPGFVSDADLALVYSKASLFVWPSLGEGFGFPPLEAMACGTPVAALDTPINREICGAAAVYHENDPDHAADAMAQVLNAPPDREGCRAHARTFTWEACARETLRVYEQAARR